MMWTDTVIEQIESISGPSTGLECYPSRGDHIIFMFLSNGHLFLCFWGTTGIDKVVRVIESQPTWQSGEFISLIEGYFLLKPGEPSLESAQSRSIIFKWNLQL